MLNQELIDDFIVHLKTKYKNLIQDLKLEYHCTDDTNVHILLRLIKIKKSQRCKGWGSAILDDILRFADTHNVRIQLYCTNIYGMDLRRLKALYKKHGFVDMNQDNDGRMIYFNKKLKNKLVLV
jgi:GNAT superfamily N-acetyltransferase